MKTRLIEQSWNDVAGSHRELIGAFYDRLFQDYPQYEPLFDRERMQGQMDRMAQTVALVSQLADNEAAIRPHLERIGRAHAPLDLDEDDLRNFFRTFVAVVGEYCDVHSDIWSRECEQAWHAAFEQIVVPHMLRGMQAS